MEFDPQRILSLIRRRWWLLLLGPLLFSAVAYSISSQQEPQYSATTTLMIVPPADSSGLSYDAVLASQNLALSYQELVIVQPVLTGVIKELGLPYTVDELKSKVSASAKKDSQVIKVSVTDTDPNRTAAIANSVSGQLQQFIATNTSVEMVVVDPAVTPGAPLAPRIQFTTFVGAFAGLLVVFGLIVLLEYFDNTVRIDTNFPVLGAGSLLAGIGTAGRLRRGHGHLFILSRPAGKAAEAIRLLRTHVQFAASAKKPLVLMITSADSGDGKSTLVANLAVAIAQTGASTVIVDANLRDAGQHRIFEADNEQGLTTLLTYPELPWQEAAIVVKPNLYLIPGGPSTPAPAELLGRGGLPELLTEIGETVDYILIDTPPLLAVSDPLVVAAAADGVILVCRAGHTRLAGLHQVASMLRQHGVRPAGVVVNRQSGHNASGYYPAPEEGLLALPSAPGLFHGTDLVMRPDNHRIDSAAMP